MAAKTDAQLTVDVDRLFRRLDRIEKQLRLVSEKVGLPMEDPGLGLPSEVVELVRAGDRLGAVKKYRELTNASADEAREAIAAL